jgi:hypothetical protein
MLLGPDKNSTIAQGFIGPVYVMEPEILRPSE